MKKLLPIFSLAAACTFTTAVHAQITNPSSPLHPIHPLNPLNPINIDNDGKTAEERERDRLQRLEKAQQALQDPTTNENHLEVIVDGQDLVVFDHGDIEFLDEARSELYGKTDHGTLNDAQASSLMEKMHQMDTESDRRTKHIQMSIFTAAMILAWGYIYRNLKVANRPSRSETEESKRNYSNKQPRHDIH